MAAEIDCDKYYTPTAVASRALERAQLSERPLVCADTACGSGSLLTAAEDVLDAMHCLGIDNDSHAIRQLRRKRPDWKLYVADLLKRHRAPPVDFPGSDYCVDLLVLNPPFSLGPRKNIDVTYCGNRLKCSVAMAHILRSLELFKPRLGAIAVVPESLLFSETDSNARDLLSQKFSFTELMQLSIYTFKGARVNSSFVQLGAATEGFLPSLALEVNARDVIHTKVLRGGLQMHSFERGRGGVRVIHSTTLRPLADKGIVAATEMTSAMARGRVTGWILLLPRVGCPHQDYFRVFNFKEEVQLSDCVIGLIFSSKVSATAARKRILDSWADLVSLYRGTGARYVTIDRLVDWLFSIGIKDKDADSATGTIKKA